MTTGVADELIASLAKAAGSPVDIDLTALVLVALFILLMIYYNLVLFRPYLRIREIRKERIQGAKQAAKETEAKANEIFDEYERNLAAAVDEGTVTHKTIREVAKEQEREILADARAELEATLDQSRADLVGQLDKARDDLDRQATEISTLIVDKVLTP